MSVVNFVFTLILAVGAIALFAFASYVASAKPKTPNDEQKAAALQAINPTVRKSIFIVATILALVAVVVIVLGSIQFAQDQKRPIFV